ncbi:MAG: type IV pili methyl-accepting chemotaxis transducer N-terminal domain-containing protein, partial [Sulfuricella sp.]
MGFKLPGFNLFKGKRDKTGPTGPTTLLGLKTTLMMKGLEKLAGDTGHALPLIGGKPLKKQMQVLAIASTVTAVLAFLPLVWYGVNLYILKQHTTTSTEMQMLSQRIAKGAQQAAQGSPIAFAQLKEADRRFADDIKSLTWGGNGVPAVPSVVEPVLKEANKLWLGMHKDIDRMVSQENNLVLLSNSVAGINAASDPLLELSDQLARQMVEANVEFERRASVRYMGMLSQRIAKNAYTLLSGSEVNPEVAFLLSKDIATFRKILSGLLNGSEELRLKPVTESEGRKKLEELNEAFQDFAIHGDRILKSIKGLVEAKGAQRTLFRDGDKMLDLSIKLTNGLNKNASSGVVEIILTVFFGGLALIFAALFAKV